MRITYRLAIVLACSLGILLGVEPSFAQKRVALVIGNGVYQKVGKLSNPPNDANAIAAMLRSSGFEVALHENLGIREMRQAINDFADIAQDADTAVVYYAGHGMEVNGINYLIPIDAVLARDTDVPYETISLDNLVQVMEPARRLRLVMLDACRDNPFLRTMKRTVGMRTVGRGLAAVEPASVNTLIAYAAKAGSYALDGEGANSPYALSLLNHLPTPGLDLRIAFGRVRDDVLKVTRSKQEPFVYGSLGGANISIIDSPGASVTVVTPPGQAPNTFIDRAAQAWGVIQNATSIAVIEDFIRQFGSTPYGSMARARLEELKKSQVAVVSPKPPVATAPQPGGTVSSTTNSFAGTWNTTRVCPIGTYRNRIELRSTSATTISGNFFDDAGAHPIFDGHIQGETITFRFTWELLGTRTEKIQMSLQRSGNAVRMVGTTYSEFGSCSIVATKTQ